MVKDCQRNACQRRKQDKDHHYHHQYKIIFLIFSKINDSYNKYKEMRKCGDKDVIHKKQQKYKYIEYQVPRNTFSSLY